MRICVRCILYGATVIFFCTVASFADVPEYPCNNDGNLAPNWEGQPGVLGWHKADDLDIAERFANSHAEETAKKRGVQIDLKKIEKSRVVKFCKKNRISSYAVYKLFALKEDKEEKGLLRAIDAFLKMGPHNPKRIALARTIARMTSAGKAPHLRGLIDYELSQPKARGTIDNGCEIFSIFASQLVKVSTDDKATADCLIESLYSRTSSLDKSLGEKSMSFDDHKVRKTLCLPEHITAFAKMKDVARTRFGEEIVGQRETIKRAVIAYSLGELRDKRAIDQLSMVMNDATEAPRVRREAIQALFKLKQHDWQKLFELCSDKNLWPFVIMSLRHTPSARASLSEFLANQPIANRLKNIRAIGPPIAGSLLLEQLRRCNEQCEDNGRLIEAVTKLRTHNILTAYEDPDSDAQFRLSLVKVLGEKGGSDVILPLANALNDPSQQVGTHALAVLGTFFKNKASTLSPGECAELSMNEKKSCKQISRLSSTETEGIRKSCERLLEKETVTFHYDLSMDLPKGHPKTKIKTVQFTLVDINRWPMKREKGGTTWKLEVPLCPAGDFPFEFSYRFRVDGYDGEESTMGIEDSDMKPIYKKQDAMDIDPGVFRGP